MDRHLTLDRTKPMRAQLEQQLATRSAAAGCMPAFVSLRAGCSQKTSGVSRGVVVEAYAQLTVEGYLKTYGSGGTRALPAVSR